MADILTANSIQELKERVNQEISRRKYYGNISSEAPNYDTPSSGVIAQANEVNNNIIEPLNLIDNDLDKESINNPIKYSYINNKLNELDDYTQVTIKNASHGCNTMCTGFCSSTCADMCVGCGGTAMGGTSNSGGGSGSSNTGSLGSTAPGCTGGCSINCYGDCVGTGTHP